MENKNQRLIQTVIELTDLPGAPGFENAVSNHVMDLAQGLGKVDKDMMQNVYIDREGNACPLPSLEGKKEELPSDRPLRIQLDAHLDEVAFLIQYIDERGMLHILPMGGWNTAHIQAHLFDVLFPDGSKRAVIAAAKPVHYMSEEERKKGASMESIILDPGTCSLQETLDLGFEIGLPVLPHVKTEYDPDRELFTGKAFDCRSGVACVLETMNRLKGEKLSNDVIGALSSQEEIGSRGAIVTARRVQADLAIVFEGCPADDTFEMDMDPQTALKKGPMLRHFDVSMVTHPGFQRYALKLARDKQIPVQTAVRAGGGTNGKPIHTEQFGIPTIVVGVPVRYAHSHYGYSALCDHVHAVDLACEIIRSIDKESYLALKN